MKKYGIYLLFPVTADLKKEGLGRQLAAFLNAALQKTDIKFVIACPSWMLRMLEELCHDYNIDYSDIEIIHPSKKNILLKVYVLLGQLSEKNKNYWLKIRKWRSLKRPDKEKTVRLLCKKLMIFGNRNLWTFFLMSLIVVTSSAVLLMLLPLFLLLFLFKKAIGVFNKLMPRVKRLFWEKRVHYLWYKISLAMKNNTLKSLKNITFLRDIFHSFQDSEGTALVEMISKRTDISVWYSPTVFWPKFNKINTPRLICVPDMVLSCFPVNFAILMGDRRQLFKEMQDTISQGQYFVTYSHDVKINTLIKKYNLDPEKIFVIPHGANQLDKLISITGTPDNKQATQSFCQTLFSNMLLSHRIMCGDEIDVSYDSAVKYIFYASQIRPNKNILSLLKAYEYLLKQRYISHKLILTGNPSDKPEIKAFIKENRLQNDVLWFQGVSSQQLAALYKLADLAVNPSLSEGGCPFTFTEALSVDTPVIMAKISVSEEVLEDPELQRVTFFDPYDYKDMANKIEWALQNKEHLLAIQKPFYTELAKRSWSDVADDYINVLDKVAQSNG